ncbi:sacsin-like protein [Labeo rohita]|uniref:Sacsin-like protein n=1 Tax=Labeo rohita TaxID=84645 RepID=A0A498NW50_LABRO|nr:sacsin-like protein [Labeo rohita]
MEASYSSSSSQSLSEGDPLQLECQVSSKTFQHTHLSVTWFLSGEEDKTPRPIITLDKDLTVKTGAGFEDRYHAGLISMDKVEETTYRLKMPQVQQSDQGKFYCKAFEWIQDPDRSWTQIAHKTTTACNVEIKRIEVAPDAGSFSVHVTASKRTLQEGNPLDIRCSVNAQNLPGYFLSVAWLKNQQKVAQIGSSGVLTIFDSYKERENAAEMRAVKTSHTDYLLTIRLARTEDQGQYQCEVWQENMNKDGTFKKIQKQMSSPETVSITAKESNLAVVMEMKDVVTEGDSLRVTCSVSGFKGPLSVSWQHKKDSGSSFSDVISLTHEGVMKDIGASKMRLYSPTSHLETTVNTDAKIDCSVTTTTTNTSRFTITWMIGSQMLLTMDLDAVVKFGPAASLEKDQRIRMEIKQKQTFQLTIHQVRTSDSGQYRCEVEEWLQDPLGDWYSLKRMTVSTQLVVKEKGESEKTSPNKDPLVMALGVTIPLICILVLVIILLLRREQKRNSELKKKKDCLWAENNPLTPIAEELIQNADDAGASNVVFIHDERHYGTQSLWTEDLREYQAKCNFDLAGPALYSFNDAAFSEEDWEGIQRVGRSIKKDDPTKVGRFGIGFNSVYHITDLPCVFSSEHLAIFDPQKKMFGDDEEGYRWSLNDEEDRESLLNLRDQFQPFQNIMSQVNSCSWEKVISEEQYFKGTLFRFPLRNEASEISDNLYDSMKVTQLFDSFIADADISLLFLRNVSSITLLHIDTNGLCNNRLKVFMTNHFFTDVSYIKQESFDRKTCFKTVSQISQQMEETKSQWLVTTCLLKQGYKPEIDSLANKLSFYPQVDTAFRLDDDRSLCNGRLSCFLPLPNNEPNKTGLPIHINGCFGLTDNRRFIKWQEEDQKNDESAMWNELLTKEILPHVYLMMILDAIQLSENSALPSRTVYNLWPDLSQTVHKERWHEVATDTLKGLFEYKIFHLADCEQIWVSASDAVFPVNNIHNETMSAVSRLLIAEGEKLVTVPEHVLKDVQIIFPECDTLTWVTPSYVRDVLHRSDIENLSKDDKYTLLEFVLSDEKYTELQGLKLLPLSDGTFTSFGNKVQNIVLIDNKKFPRTLLPFCKQMFLPNDLSHFCTTQLRKLATKGDIVLTYPPELDLTPYIKKVPEEFLQYENLLTQFGVKKTMSDKEIEDILHDIKQRIDSRCPPHGDSTELKVSIAILEWMRKNEKHLKDITPVPVMAQNQNFTLQPLSKTVFCDISAEGLEDLKQDNEEFYVIHEEVLPITARWLKVPFLSTRILKPQFIQAEQASFGIEQCGQSEPITQRIKNILKEYDEESDIFKELLQNAEDAGATTCKFLIDFRKHRDPPETLIDNGMSLCNGPCLWIFNNELFSQEDWKNIVKVGSASKQNNVEMIGKFGLGFNAVYHVSDIPSILSGNTLLILDPNVTHLEKHIISKGNPGIKLDPFLERLYKRFPGQFKSYEGIFDCDLSVKNSKKAYNGTLIKLPFRTLEEANKSEISSKIYDKECIHSFKNHLTDNSEMHLLFLKRIKSLSLQIVPENASTPPQDDQIQTPLKISREIMTSFEVSNDKPLQEIKSTFRNTDIAGNNIIDFNRAHIVKIVQEHSERSLTQYWLLYSCFGTQDSKQMFQRRNEQEHAFSVPIGGVAVPLHREANTKAWSPDESLIGQAFCFLPLSIETGLPVHINGTFAVTSNRKGLWEKGVKSEWNKALLKDAVTSAYITTLLVLKEMAQNGHIENYPFYAFWPNREKASKAFLPLVESFYSTVAEHGNGKSLDLFSNGNNWCSMDKVRFLNPKIEKNQAVRDIAMKMFLSLGASYCVVSLPTWVRDSFNFCGFKEMIKQKTINWPEFYNIVFKNLSAVDTHNRNLLVLNAIDLNDPAVDELLKSYPCIPTQKCQKLQFIKRLVNPFGKVACLYELEEGRILEGTANDFLSPKIIHRLSDLGMLSDRLPLKDIIERAGKISSVWQQDKFKFRKCLQCLMESMKDSSEDVYSLHWLTLSQIPFLPALAPSVQQNKNTTILKKPSEVYSDHCRSLVGMTEFTVDHSVLQIHSYDPVFQKLGVRRNPPVETVLQQLLKAHQHCSAFEKTAVFNIAQSCYDYLNNYLLEQKDPNPIIGHAKSYPFIFIEDHFVNVKAVARSEEFEQKPYLYVLPVIFSKFERLWDYLGVKKQFTKEQFVAAIEEMKASYGSHPLSTLDLHKCAAILVNGLYKITDKMITDCLIPDESGVLTSSKELRFNDSPWMPVSAGVKLSHELIPRPVACHFGVMTTRHHTLEEHFVSGFSLHAKEFGQTEKLTVRIKNIIEAYPSKKDILKELIQNADDAEATEIHFVWDKRKHKTKKIFGKKWELVQGPALCVYNNRTFSDADLQGIQQLGEGGKHGTLGRTGKYGLGFNSVYHLTDCPSILTGDKWLCISDPNLKFMEGVTKQSPGCMFLMQDDFKKSFEDVYDTFLPEMFDLNSGTMFRLPLRTEKMAEISKISRRTVTDRDMKDLYSALTEDPEGLILFLKHITKIKCLEISEDGKHTKCSFLIEKKCTEKSMVNKENFHRHVKESLMSGTAEPCKTMYIILISSGQKENGKLYKSSTLFFNDTVFQAARLEGPLETKLKLLEKLDCCHLGNDHYEHQTLLQLLPQQVRPKFLSDIISENLGRTSVQLCDYEGECEFSGWFYKHLSSAAFLHGLICLIREESKGSVSHSEAAEKCEEIFSKIQIICCKTLQTELLLNHEPLEGSKAETDVYVKKQQNGCSFYLKHNDDMAFKVVNEVTMCLTKEINARLKNCLTTSSLLVLVQLLLCDNMEDVEKALAKYDIHNSGYKEEGHGSLPKPGCCIPEEWHDCLDMNFLNNFENGEYVGFSKDKSGEYFYAIVIEGVDDSLGQTRQFPARYKIQVGSDDFTEVSSLDLYQFKREKKATVSKESTCTDIERLLTSRPPPKTAFPETLEEIKREIDQSLYKILKMSSEDKQKALKRLYLRWHPDKNPDNEALATEAFKYLQNRIEELQRGTIMTTTTAQSTSSNWRDFRDFYDMWNTEARSHRRGRERFYQNYSRRHYNFWSYHRETPRPNREEAKRWYEQAQCDIKSAHNDTGGKSSEWCLFKVHQAVEKALIAAIYRGSGHHPNNCSITSLALQASHFSSQLASLPNTVRQLTELGVDGKKTQYPNYHQFPHIPNKRFGIENARRALDIATNLLEKIEEYIS